MPGYPHETAKGHYNLLEPVYELFIKPFPSKEERMTYSSSIPLVRVRRPLVRREKLVTDLQHLVHPISICLNGNNRVDWNQIPISDPLRSIGILADPILDVSEAARLMERDYGFALNDYTKEVKHHMYTMYDWVKDAENASREEGRAEGMTEGRVQGQAEGRVQGRAEGRGEGRAEVFAKLRSRHVDEALIRDIEADFLKAK